EPDRDLPQARRPLRRRFHWLDQSPAADRRGWAHACARPGGRGFRRARRPVHGQPVGPAGGHSSVGAGGGTVDRPRHLHPRSRRHDRDLRRRGRRRSGGRLHAARTADGFGWTRGRRGDRSRDRRGACRMRREPPQKALDYAPLAFPAAMLILFFVVPFGTMIAVSFFQRNPAGFYSPALVLDNYARFISPFFAGVLGFSLMLAIAVAVVCVVAGLPFTYLLARMSRKAQVLWLVALLSILSLSEVIIGFAWSTL